MRSSHAVRRSVLEVVLLLVLATVARPSTVLAHAHYDSSTPTDGEVLAVAPDTVAIWFTEGIQAEQSWIHVLDSSGARVDVDDSAVTGDDSTGLTVRLQSGLADGVYTVAWQNLSEDGDGLTGSFRFGVGADTVVPPAPAAGPVPQIAIESVTVRGHEARIQVHVDGATLGTGAPAMDMNTNMPMPMATTGAPMDASAMPQAHLHVYVDGDVAPQMIYQPEVVLSNLASGTHEVRIVLADDSHQDWDPPVVASTTVTVP